MKLTISDAKKEVCMAAVEVVVKTMRDFGAVCENCVSYRPNASVAKNNCGICGSDCHEVHGDSFCESFQFKFGESCEELYQKIVKNIGVENDEIS